MKIEANVRNLSKTVGAGAPTASILTGALCCLLSKQNHGGYLLTLSYTETKMQSSEDDTISSDNKRMFSNGNKSSKLD